MFGFQFSRRTSAHRKLVAVGLLSVGIALISSPGSARATSLSWDQAGGGALGGTGTWDTTSTNWWNGAGDVAWSTNTTSGDTAVFAGTPGIVTLGADINANGLKFSTAGYTIAGSNTLGIGTGGVDDSALNSGTTTISSTIKVATGIQKWTVGGGTTLALGAIGAGADAADTYTPNGAIVFISQGAGATISTTAVNGWGWRGGGPGLLGPGMVIDNGNHTYDWASANSGVIGAATYMAAGSGDKNNVLVTSNATVNLNASWASIKVSGATLTANGANLYVDTGLILQNGGAVAGSAPLKANSDGLYVYTPDSGAISSSIQNNGSNAKILYKAGSGALSLSGNDTYTGATIIDGGTLNVSGTGNINGTSGITINGSDAKYVQTSSTASTRTITLTQGSVDGTGTLGTVNVASLAANTISNGNGGSNPLTIGTLVFAGSGAVNVNEGGTTAGLALTTFTTANSGAGEITINAANSAGWSSGTTYDLVTFTSLTGTLADFTQGTISGISGRQNATLGMSTTALTLAVAGDNPIWTGAGSQTWKTMPTNDNTGPNAWALKTGHTATNFWVGDAVEFNDTYNLGSGPVAVTNTTATIHGGVAPVSTSFNNSAVDYTINSDDGTGITSGTLSKSGTGTVTLNTVNSYTSATTVSAGALVIGGSGSLGSGNYAGAIGNNGTFTYNSSAAQTFSGVISGTGAFNVIGSGALTLSGANTFSGQLTIAGGTVKVATLNNTSVDGPLGNSALPVILGGTGINGTLEYTGAGAVATSKGFTLADGGTGTIQVDNANGYLTLTAANGLTGSGQLIKTGPGGLAMGDGGQNWTGGLVIAEGLVQGGNNSNNFGTGGITLGLQGSSHSASIGLGNGGVTASNALSVASGSGTRTIIGGSGGNETFTGAVTLGDGSGAGNLNLTTIYAGSSSSQLIMSGAVSGTGNINMYANNVYNANGSDDVTLAGAQTQTGTISSIDVPGGVTNPTHGVNRISGALEAGITNVTQNSSNSSLEFNGDNSTFTGTVTVSQGTLTVNTSTGSGAVTVNGGTLKVVGTVDGNLAVNGGLLTGTGSTAVTTLGAGGTIAPGTGGIGTLSTGNLTWTSGGTMSFDLSSVDNLSDLLAVNGVFDLSSGSNFTFNFTGGMVGQTYTLVTFGTAGGGLVSGSQFTAQGATGDFTLDRTAGTLTFTLAAVPEPGTIALVVTGMSGLLLIARQRGSRRA
jgi:autotransporter-associated beta strand protein